MSTVSVVTPTWGRHDLLLGRCIPSVRAQTYRPLEHVVVSDGPDPVLREKIAGLARDRPDRLRFAELPEHDEQARWGHWARLHGIEMAKGDYITYLDSDDALRPCHARVLAAALDAHPEAGFAYGQVIGHNLRDDLSWRIGVDPPVCGQITVSVMHRRELLDVATWEQSLPTIDWDLISRWMNAGIGWVMAGADTVDMWPSEYHD